MTERPLETGWLADTPIADTTIRRFLHNQADVDDEMAKAAGGRIDRTDAVALADSGGPAPFLNQAVLLRPLTGGDDPVLDTVEQFYAGAPPSTLLSVWPTPDLSARGWSLVGHPAFVARSPAPVAHDTAAGVDVRFVESAADLATVERVLVEGFPMEEAAGAEPGEVLAPALLDGPVRFLLGTVDGEPAAGAAVLVAHGVVNLCMAATLPLARRRGVWAAMVWARVGLDPTAPAAAFTSDDSRPGFERMGFMPLLRFTLWSRGGA